ncbi:hypothetical protein NDU88_000860 [Pleurodeles waltl]|uniref:Uncharacterized protein n=1 Tax=Pleurodeles waltl TaxID=8319 RepID=A0AAV7S8F2_PLEWA|nr:hypothetical protein NDU88_000860 [Pleurodeles waltl]
MDDASGHAEFKEKRLLSNGRAKNMLEWPDCASSYSNLLSKVDNPCQDRRTHRAQITLKAGKSPTATQTEGFGIRKRADCLQGRLRPLTNAVN